ncbi:hypothetical protein A2483_03610 [Candidatus Peregrinibacteria bacterium RIFOXYC2_FULL_33_13]|nr:MAG: hypothetical protein UR27_C0011G0027 [Candidatus Peregrinibacteria bacterium GW2011_GWA2_33_10]KKP38889.1 MAG: hypothetical protein UR30_C0014G0027 [Candidatus Peregrinibacteria bacterium GW2011_GWC2_33_13]OGJ46712.1 MAG: hypothetical protein A2229_02775 [Candidatus Peregrinibacteria bacterium RIFOXYA2_FULL_33_7]OGJ52878.1 MAG: hypothetical protein A2483_03610 [Candidatus Peregrinibacteria bacterium RIFOXYC2_FULL_33_13]
MRLNNLFKKNWLFILTIFSVTFIFFLFDIYLLATLQDNYHPFLIDDVPNNSYYQSYNSITTKEALEGKSFPSDPYVFENKDKFIYFPLFQAFFIGKIGSLLHLDLFGTYVVTKIIFSILLSLSSFLFIEYFTKSKLIAFLGTLSLCFGLEMLWDRTTLIPKIIIYFLTGNKPLDMLELSTFPVPLLPLSLLLLQLTYSAEIFFSDKKINWINNLIIGLAWGIMGYLQFFYWLFFFLFYPLFSLYFIWTKKYTHVKNIIIQAIIAILASIPLIFNILLIQSNEIAVRGGVIFNHKPNLDFLIVSFLLIFIITYIRKDKNFYFLLSIFLATILGMNLQVIIGQNIQIDHWHMRVTRPFAIICAFILFHRFQFIKIPLNGIKKLLKLISKPAISLSLSLIFFLIIIINASFIQITAAQYYKNKITTFNNTYYSSLEWLSNNSQKNDVILSSPYTSMLIPLYTDSYSYLASGYSFSSEEEIIDRAAIYFALIKIEKEKIIELLNTRKTQRFFFNDQYYPGHINGEDRKMTPKIFQKVIDKYNYYLTQDLEKAINKYKINYFYIDQNTAKINNRDFTEFKFLKLVYEDKENKIYETNNL